MSATIDLKGTPFHFIGIGGIGMSALAYILAKRNLPVSGSDVKSSHITQRLANLGVAIFDQQVESNFDHIAPLRDPVASLDDRLSTPVSPQVIISTAISNGNAEYQAALNKGYPIFHRSDLLSALMADYQSIGVAGTHGKTTTSSLISYMLLNNGLDPTVIVGGEVSAWEGNARVGSSPYLVAEADESDGTLAKLPAKIGVITNIELDHPDHYQSLDEVISIFQTFAQRCEVVIGCLDCETVKTAIQPHISYSLDPTSLADYTVKNVQYHRSGSRSEVWEKGAYLGEFNLSLLGGHNLSNALAVVAVGRYLGLSFEDIARSIESFEGAKRRFEHRGSAQGITFIDDYAHHPSELKATLNSARLRVGEDNNRRVVAIFQPHRYSRTQTFLQEFALSFAQADLVILTDIYSAGEKNLDKITGESVAHVFQQHHPHVLYHPDLATLSEFLQNHLQTGDLVLFLGAGNLNQTIPQLLQAYRPES